MKSVLRSSFRSFSFSLLPVTALAALVACSSKSDAPAVVDDSGTSPDVSTDSAEAGPADPFGEGPSPTKVALAPACAADLATDGAALAFTDKTAKWELGEGALDVFGNHIEAIDLDADGYPDLLVHTGGSARNDPAAPAKSRGWRVLLNRAKDGGGRHFVESTDSGYGEIRPDAPVDGKLRTAQLAVAGDVDGDGDLDLFSGTYVDPTHPETDTKDRNEILLGDGTGKFKLATKSDVQKVPTGFPPTSGASFVDADRDGILDVWVGFWYKSYGSSEIGVQARLFKGVGDGTFVDATPGSGLETRASGFPDDLNHKPSYGVTTCDLDDDNLPELIVSAYGRQWNNLYKNASTPGAMAFTEIGKASGFAGDDNYDYSDNEFYKCYCKTSGTCTPSSPPKITCPSPAAWDPSSDPLPWRNNGNTFTTACADFNGDGKLDLYNATIKHWHIGQSADASNVLFNDGATADAPIHFQRPDRAAIGVDWVHTTTDWNEGGIFAAPGDLDLDGLEDILVGATDYPENYSLIFKQKTGAPGTFEEVGQKIGLHHACANGMAVADFDRDGDLDVVVGSSTARDCAKSWPRGPEVHFYENALNDGAKKRAFLQVQLAGKGKGASNGTGIGARVKVAVGGKILTKELGGGYGTFGMQNDTVLTFGLGSACTPDEIEVRWPDAAGSKVRFTGVGSGRRVLVTEGGSVTEAKPK